MPNIRPEPAAARIAATRRQAKTVYLFIQGFFEEYGFGPSLDEIAAGCYMSRSTVARYLDKLEAWGLLTREFGVARSLRLLPDEHGVLRRL